MASDKLPSSPLTPTVGATARGKVLQERGTPPRWERGSILDNSSAALTGEYVVSTELGTLHKVPRLVNDPGEVTVLAVGTTVLVHREIGIPIIAGVIKLAATDSVEVNPLSLTEVRGVGGEDLVHSNNVNSIGTRPPNDPIDILGDDWIRKSKDNNFVGVLSGGSNVVHSSPLAQVRTHNYPQDMVEVIANVYRHISSLGNLEIKNDGGKTSLVWRAGASQTTESGANLENWTIQLDAGSTGDLFRLRVTTPTQNTLCELHMSADGRLSMTGVAGIDVTSGNRGTYREDVAEDKEVSVAGEMITSVGGNVAESIGGLKSVQVVGNHLTNTGNDLQELVGNSRLSVVSNTMRTTVNGGPVPTPGTVGVFWDVPGGGVDTVTGSPTVPSGMNQNFINKSGSINFSIPSTEKFNVIASGNDSIVLGANGAAVPLPTGGFNVTAVGLEHVAKYEPLRDIINTLIQWMDTHTHLSAVGPTSPGAAGSAGPVSPTVQANLPLAQSLRVLVGG